MRIQNIMYMLLLAGCMQVNTSDAIAHIGQGYEAAIVRQDLKQWNAVQVGDKQYIEGRRVSMSKHTPPRVEDAAFAQLPHQVYYFEGTPGPVCYYNPVTGEKLARVPDGAAALQIKANPPHLFAQVSPRPGQMQKKAPFKYTPLYIEELENPHSVYTVPLSYIAAVVVDIPGSFLATVAALPYNIYSVISD